MSSLLQKLKQRSTQSSNSSAQQIIEVSAEAKFVVCKNHFMISPKGVKTIVRTIINFIENEPERLCECGILYKKKEE
jgi:hypothetical protein